MAEHFVTPSGSGAQNGTSWADSWSYADLNTAGNWGGGGLDIMPGDTVYLSGGASGETYSGTLTVGSSGSAGNPITIKPGAGHATLSAGHDGKVVIHTAAGAALACTTKTYITVDGGWSGFPTVTNWKQAQELTDSHFKLKFVSDTSVGINFKGSNCTFSKIEVGNCGDTEDSDHGFQCNPNAGQEPTGTIVEYCYVHDNLGDAYNQNRSANTSETDLIIRYCHFKDNKVDGIQSPGGLSVFATMFDGSANAAGAHADGMQINGGNIRVISCGFKNWPQSLFFESITGADFDNVHVVNNTFWVSGDYAGTYMLPLSLSNNSATSLSLSGFIFAFNTIDTLRNRNFVSIGANPEPFVIRSSKIVNNILYNCPALSSPIGVDSGNDISADSDLLITNNIFYANEKISYRGNNYTTIASFVAAHPLMVDNLVGDPAWTDSASLDYSVPGGSIAVAAGVVVDGYTTDALGVSRTSTPTIGAFEYGGPTAPSDLTATATGSSTIALAWTDNSDDETGFKVERSLNGSTGWTQIGTAAADATSYSDTGLSSGTTYYYRVRSYNTYGNSAYSASANDTTDAAPVVGAGRYVGSGAVAMF